MNRSGFRAVSMIAAAGCVAAAGAQTLTGINWYTTNSSKQYNGGYANTYGGDTYSRNLYVTENQAVGAGALLNSGNLTTLPTRVQIDLSAPGTYTFQMYCNDESTVGNPFWGLNLFFNNDDLRPGISAWNVVNSAGYQSVNPVGTPTLDPRTMGLVQAGAAGSSGDHLTFALGMNSIQLLSYSTWSVNHYNADRVDNFSDMGGLGNGTKDDVIEFSLKVNPVPEPCTLAAVGAGAALLMRRRSRSSLRGNRPAG